MSKFSLYLISGGTIGLAISLVMGFLGFDQIISWSIVKNARLRKGSEAWQAWVEPTYTIPIIEKFFIFNVTNPQEIQEGGKPILKAIGPYTYREKIQRINVVTGKMNDTVLYNEKSTYTFQKNISIGSDTDTLTFLNIPYVGLANLLNEIENLTDVLPELDRNLTEKGETLFKSVSVREFLFEGYSVQNYLDLKDDPLISPHLARLSESFSDGQFGLYKLKNGTSSDRIEVFSGMDQNEWQRMRNTWKVNNMTFMPWWKDENCSNLTGTDGLFFRPFSTNTTTLQIYLGDACRVFDFDFEGEFIDMKTPGFRFTQNLKNFQGVKTNPDNECFCSMKNEDDCNTNGVISVSECWQGFPSILMSAPHFLLGSDPEMMGAVSGLHPEIDKHQTFIEIEPTTGATMRANYRFQINIQVKSHKNMPTFASLQNLILPIVWTEEVIEVPNAGKFYKITQESRKLVEENRMTCIGASLTCLAIGIFLSIFKRERIQHTKLTKS